jgi:ABC-type ATPase involved in cell division
MRVIATASGGVKITLVKLMLGALSPSEGEAWIGGRPLQSTGLPDHRSLTGTAMQDDGRGGPRRAAGKRPPQAAAHPGTR